MKISELNNASEATKRLNPELFRSPVAQLSNTIGEQKARLSLVAKARRKNRRFSRAQVRVSIISCRQRLLDSDNLVAGAKQLRDVIAEILGCDDAEGSGIEWYYHQIASKGEQGVIVRIEAV